MKNLNMGQSGFSSLSAQARQVIFDLVYPIGSYIYIDSPGFNTVAKVEAYFGGHWEQIADGTFIEAGSTPGAHEPGLPNITGKANSYFWLDGMESGALRNLKDHGGTLNDQNHNASISYGEIRLDASKSNSIYGSSTTVQPKSKVVYIYHRIPVQNS